MQPRFLEHVQALRANHQHFVIATVIAVRGSSSAKPGARALISAEGRNLCGWIGGGCAESYVIEQGLEALSTGSPRVVTVDLDDELLGVGMPCGGMMDVYLEPCRPPRRLALVGDTAAGRILAVLADMADLAVTVHGIGIEAAHYPMAQLMAEPPNPPDETDWMVSFRADGVSLQHGSRAFVPALALAPEREGAVAQALTLLAALVAEAHAAEGRPLRATGGRSAPLPPRPTMMLLGRGRIVEELARLSDLLGWPVIVNHPDAVRADYPARTCLLRDDLTFVLPEAGPHTCLIIASQHKGDHQAALAALAKDVGYIGLVASRKRAGLVLDWLRERGQSAAALEVIHAPAGLALGGTSPFEIALSIVCELLTLRQV